MPSEYELESCAHIVLTYVEVGWYPSNVTMDRNILYGDKACVVKISRNRSKGSPSDIFHESDLILGLITDALVGYTGLEQLIL